VFGVDLRHNEVGRALVLLRRNSVTTSRFVECNLVTFCRGLRANS
jgi:hypothetical protein